MNKINEQIAKLEKELEILKRDVSKPKDIKLSEPMKDINGNLLKLNFKDANEYARLIGSRLPTKEELENLSEEQKAELIKDGHSLWSSESYDEVNAWFFYGNFGFLNYGYRSDPEVFRCVVP